MAHWVADVGPQQVITGLIDALEIDFRRWNEFAKAPRVAAHSPHGVIELMPINDRDRYAFKYVNGHPTNPARGFQTVTAFGVLANVDNGYPVLLAEMTLLTALRTAAVSGLAARYLAPAGSRRAAFIGAGSQSEFQALAVRAATGIDQISVYDVESRASEKLARNLRPLGFDVSIAPSAVDAAEGADVVTTCTADKANAVVLPDDAIPPGVFINAIGGDCPGKTELDPRTVSRAHVVVEYEPQTRIEGEIQAQASDFPVTELWQIIRGGGHRVSPQGLTIFDSVGFALEDFTALRYVASSVAGTAYAEPIDLIADPEDPRDLFGLIPAPVPTG